MMSEKRFIFGLYKALLILLVFFVVLKVIVEILL